MRRRHLENLAPLLTLAFACGACSSDQDEPSSQATGGTSASGGDSPNFMETGGEGSGTGGTNQVGSGESDSGSGGTPTGGSGSVGTGGESTGTPSACEPSVSEANRTLVGKALDELFIDKDLSAIDRYWAEPYLQHNPIATSGIATFKSVMGSIVTSPSFQFSRLRTLADCDLVVVQGRYSGTGVIFDMFRVGDGKIMEHWDSDANQASSADGATDLSDFEKTPAHRTTFDEFFSEVLSSGASADVSDFLGEAFISHRAGGTSGPAAWSAYLTSESINYSKVHHQIVDGNFVFTLSEGTKGPDAFGFYDLFRFEAGVIVEHWDSRRAVPDSTASGLEIF